MNYEVKNNVIQNFMPLDDTSSGAGIWTALLDEDYNVFGDGWTWVPGNMGPHSIEDDSPTFVNATTSAAADLATGDFRLQGDVSAGGATYTAGITWQLAGRLFGTDRYGFCQN